MKRRSLYTPAEEIAHSVTHGVGAILSVAGLGVLVTLAAVRGSARHVVTCGIFGATLIVLYTTSTLYHGVSHPPAKRLLQRLDHAAIFLLIAGTYTPFTLVRLRGGWGWTLFGLVWGLALLGVLFKLTAGTRFPVLSTLVYLLMGWLVLIALKPLAAAVAPPGIALLVAGGLAYTGGVAFYASSHRRYSHAIWHLCVLVGSLLHYLAVMFYVIPPPR